MTYRSFRWLSSLAALLLLGATACAAGGAPPASTSSSAAAAPAAAATAGGPAAAKPTPRGPLRKVVFASAAPSQNPLFENIEVGKALGFYEQEGLDVEFQYLGSNAAVMAALLSDKAQLGVCTQDYQITYLAQGNPLKTTCFYEYSYPMKWNFTVPADSPLQSYAELKGKNVGLIGLGTADESIARKWLTVANVDPASVNFQVIGDGTPAGVALTQQKRVDAMLTWDTTLGTWDVAGIKYRVLPRPANLPQVGGFSIQATSDKLTGDRQLLVGFARAVAKGTIFALTNPSAAADLYLKMHPEAASSGLSRPDAIKNLVTIVAHRAEEWNPLSNTPWGQANLEEWKNGVELAKQTDKVPDPSVFFTNALIPEINTFDADTIRSQAKDYKLSQ